MRSFHRPVAVLLAFLVVAARATENDTVVPGEMFSVCGNNNPCMDGLDCSPVPGSLFKRCAPVTCAEEAMKAFYSQSSFDFYTYPQDIMEIAGVSRRDLWFEVPTYGGLNSLEKNRSATLLVWEALKNNPPDKLDVLDNALQNCTGAKQGAGYTLYTGVNWGIGAALTYEGEVFYGQGTADTGPVGVLNNCFGFVLGYDAQIAALIGIAWTDRLANLQEGCKQTFPLIDIPPCCGFQIGFQDCSNPIFLFEFTAGASASAGLPGYTSCTVQAI